MDNVNDPVESNLDRTVKNKIMNTPYTEENENNLPESSQKNQLDFSKSISDSSRANWVEIYHCPIYHNIETSQIASLKHLRDIHKIQIHDADIEIPKFPSLEETDDPGHLISSNPGPSDTGTPLCHAGSFNVVSSNAGPYEIRSFDANASSPGTSDADLPHADPSNADASNSNDDVISGVTFPGQALSNESIIDPSNDNYKTKTSKKRRHSIHCHICGQLKTFQFELRKHIRQHHEEHKVMEETQLPENIVNYHNDKSPFSVIPYLITSPTLLYSSFLRLTFHSTKSHLLNLCLFPLSSTISPGLSYTFSFTLSELFIPLIPSLFFFSCQGFCFLIVEALIP